MPETETRERIEVKTEPLTYDHGAPTSYLRDLALSERSGDTAAVARLVRHEAEMRVELPKLERRGGVEGQRFERRVNPTSTTSTFAPPLWVIQDFAAAPNTQRVLSNLVQQFPLPRGVHSVNLPRLTTGASVLPQQDGTGVASADVVDAASQSIVTTLAGQADTSLQLLEQSPPGAHLDFALFQEMSSTYDAQLELQLLNGTGTGENLLGILNAALPTANKVAYTDATPTGAELVLPLGQAFASIGNNRKQPPQCWLMRSSRWAYLASQSSTGGNPLLLADWGPAGQGIMSIPAHWHDAIPTTLGAGGNQDAMFCLRPSDIILWETDQRTSVNFEVLSGTLQARFQLHGSAASIIRYPTGQATITGTGMIPATGF